jgi:hypothetical protein
MLLIVHCTLNIENCSAQSWTALGSGLTYPGYGTVEGLIVYNNELIAGGNFNNAGGVTVHDIAKWNGTSWSSFSVEPGNGTVRFTIFNNELVASGGYTGCIKKWNGTSWSGFGNGLGPVGYTSVWALTVFNNQLIAGGGFKSSGTDSVFYIAKWNGTNWVQLGSRMTGPVNYTCVNALTVFNNELIAGGAFNTAGGVTVNNIAKWNGSSWSPLGSGMFKGNVSNVSALIVYNNQLIAGGCFDSAGGVPANSIAKWNGSSWSPLGSGVGGSSFYSVVKAFTIINNELIAAGDFKTAGGISANYIAKWNGTSWSPLGSGLVANISNSFPVARALATYNNKVIVGGMFYGAGSLLVNNIAQWGTNIGIKQISQNVPDKFSLSQNYPNPFNPATNIRYQIPKLSSPHALSGDPVTLKIFDALGREIEILVNEKHSPGTYEVTWDASNYPSGIYFYKLETSDFTKTLKMILIK